MNDQDSRTTTSLPTGDDQTKLQSGSDLAQAALDEARQTGLSAGDDDPVLPASDDTRLPSGNDEVAESNQLAETISSLQNVIERNADLLDETKKKLKQFREEMRSVFENDTALAEAQEQASQFTQQVKEQKTKLQSNPVVTSLQAKIGELNEQKKEIEEALSGHLVNYYQLTNSTSFDTSDGDQREFSIKASVKGRARS